MKRQLFFRSLFLVLAVVSSSGGGQKPTTVSHPIVPQPTNASIINLISTPERYDGKMVSVVGFLALEPEDSRLYLSQSDYRQVILDNGIFIDANKEVTRDLEAKDLHYVQVVGVFKQKGLPMHFPGGAGDAGITDIRLCLPWIEVTEKRPRELKDSHPARPH